MAVTPLSSPATITLSRNPVLLRTQTDVPLTSENLKIKLTIYVETIRDSGNYDDTTSWEMSPDEDGKARFNLSEILNSYFDEKTFPTIGRDIITKMITQIKRYYFTLAEVYGDPPVEYPGPTSDVKYVMDGGIAFEEFSGVSFFTLLANNKNFLTWAPDNRKVTPSQQEYLFYYHSVETTTEIRWRANIYYTDGTSVLDQEAMRARNVTPYNVYFLPAGIFGMGLQNVSPAKTIDYYEVFLKDDTGAITLSTTRTYINEQKTYRTVRNFLFKNSLGGIDTIRSLGRGVESLGLTKNKINNFDPTNYSVIKGMERSFGHKARLSKSVSLGHMNTEEIEHLTEVVLSPKMVEVVNGQFLPIDPTKKNFRMLDDEANIQHLVMDYEYLFDQHSYTPTSSPLQTRGPDFNDDFNDDFNNDQVNNDVAEIGP